MSDHPFDPLENDPAPFYDPADTIGTSGGAGHIGSDSDGGWTPLDVDGDHLVDAMEIRLVDGTLVQIQDSDGDGAVDVMLIDSTGDRRVDALIQQVEGGYVITQDTDGDGIADAYQALTNEEFAAAAPTLYQALQTHLDRPTDHAPVLSPDQNVPSTQPPPGNTGHDGGVPTQGPVRPGQPGFPADPGESPDDPAHDPIPEQGDGPDVGPHVIGDPSGASVHWFNQAVSGNCVPASVAFIVSEYTGRHFPDEWAFVHLAESLHVFPYDDQGKPVGMTMDATVTLLNAAGVPAHQEHGTLSDLAEALYEGRSVIAFVDSGEVWYGEATEDDVPDHAVVVAGIDLDRGVVILEDPGSPDGKNEEVPIAVFDDAWSDSGHTMVVCDQPAPHQATPVGADIQGSILLPVLRFSSTRL